VGARKERARPRRKRDGDRSRRVHHRPRSWSAPRLGRATASSGARSDAVAETAPSSQEEDETMIREYEQGTEFPGKIGRTVEESERAWPAPVRAAEGAPNARRPTTRRSTSRCSGTARSTTTAGGGMSVAGPRLRDGSAARSQVGRPDHAGDPRPARRSGLGAVRHGDRSDGVPQRRRRASRPAARTGRTVVDGGREVQGVAGRRVDTGAARR